VQRSHDKIIGTAAKQTLHPLGFFRKGRSRTWLADNGWWLVVVEFQPSGWDKGSYLNVGAHWLWSRSGHLSFDFGYRVGSFAAYETDEQFAGAVGLLAESAADRARELIKAFPDVGAAAAILTGQLAGLNAEQRGSWPALYAGIAAGLAGRTDDASRLLGAVNDDRVRLQAEALAGHADDAAEFRRVVSTDMVNQRQALKLPSLAATALPA
jgi:hypothetical protein